MDILSLIEPTLMYSTPIIIAALGGLFSERSGVVNIALEGIMLVGAFAAATAQVTISSGNPWMSLVIGAFAGLLFSVLHAFASINFKADQVISGTALNIISGGMTVYLTSLIFGETKSPTFGITFSKIDIPLIGKTYPTFILALVLVIISYLVLKYTKFGLRLRSCGEYPQASESAGINVYLYRYFGVLISGALAGVAGGIMVLTQDTRFSITAIHGMGFIALAALIFGKWDARGILFASLFFGFTTILNVYSKSIDALQGVSQEIFQMIPYVFTIIALVITSGKSKGPKASGEIYDKGKR
ncbi:MAG: ABC transporter permease [Bacilli bacterium]